MALPDGPRSRVVLIGASVYQNHPGLPSVRNNLSELAEALGDPMQGWLDPVHCTVVSDPERASDITNALKAPVRQAEDLLLVYYAGHGMVEDADEYYLAVADSDPDEPSVGSMPYRTLKKIVLGARARNRVVILDACWSGTAIGSHMAGGQDPLRRMTAIDGAFVLASSAHDSVSLAPVGERFTAFTGELIKLLRDGSPQLGPELTLENVYQHLRHALEAKDRPRPVRNSTNSVSGLVIARNRGYQPDSRPWRSEHARHPGLQDGRLLLDDEERAGHIGNHAAAVDGYTNVAQVLTRLFGPKDEMAEAAERSRGFWTGRHRTALSEPRESDLLTGFRTVGIELGAASCMVAHQADGRLEVVINAEGALRTPSVVAYTGEGGRTVLVGEPARRQAVTNLARTFRLSDPWWDGWCPTTVADEPAVFEQICTELLRKLKRDAEAQLGERVARAVISVPVGMDEARRRRVRRACEAVGIEPMRIISVPLAAGLALGRQLGDQEASVLAVCLGAGTVDVAVLELADGVVEVKAVAFDDRLGGESWTRQLADGLRRAFETRHRLSLGGDRPALQRLREAADQAVRELGSAPTASVRLPYLTTVGPNGPCDLEDEVTRGWFEQLTAGLAAPVEALIEQALREAYLSPDQQVDQVLLIGEAARYPGVADVVRRASGRERINTGVDPDRLAAHGAALQAGVLLGDVKDVLPLDVTARSIGIELADGGMAVVLEQNTTYPTVRSATFSTSFDAQPFVNINVYEGESPVPARNRFLAGLTLNGLPPARCGVPQIEVAVEVNAHGQVGVEVKDRGTGRSLRVRDVAGAASPVVPAVGNLPAMLPEVWVEDVPEEVQEQQ